MNKQLNERNKYIMKLEVGMYVRTKQGYIAKFKEYDEIFDVLRFETPIFLRSWMPCDYMQKERFVNRYFLKASFDIIDLIEIGDYVNGSEICKISWDSLGLILETTDYFKIRETDIKTVVTKEQFESRSYRIGDK